MFAFDTHLGINYGEVCSTLNTQQHLKDEMCMESIKGELIFRNDGVERAAGRKPGGVQRLGVLLTGSAQYGSNYAKSQIEINVGTKDSLLSQHP